MSIYFISKCLPVLLMLWSSVSSACTPAQPLSQPPASQPTTAPEADAPLPPATVDPGPDRIDALLDEADEAVANADWDVVREKCDTVLRLDHDNEDAKHFLEAAAHDTRVGPASSTPSPE